MPLTERVWNNIRPKLTSLLEANVDRRLKGEKQERLLWVCMDIADIRAEEEASQTATLVPPFPQDSDISDWEMIRTIIEQQYSAEEADEIFDKHREQIQQAISTWRREAEQYFAGLIRQEHPDQTIPKPQIIRDSVDESLQSLSEDAAILLRADSLFHAASGADGCAYSYHNALALPRSAEPRERHTSSYFNWDSSMFRMHSRGSLIARTLLQEIGQPDASFLEFREIRQFSCGRCGSIMLRTWEEMVSHYILEQAEWEKIQAHIPTFTELDIPYNCTHELTPKHDPLIKLLTTVEATTLRLQEARRSTRQSQCRLCEKASVKYVELEDHTKIHIQTVHGIAEPDAVKHYKIKTSIPKGHRKRKGRSVR
ncbi:hypothetical protein FRC08_009581 [Ceratobasidium sp. 394]|nr:hypothetical protein FRC08_009581 [Ceratobasidium sp. 394]